MCYPLSSTTWIKLVPESCQSCANQLVGKAVPGLGRNPAPPNFGTLNSPRYYLYTDPGCQTLATKQDDNDATTSFAIPEKTCRDVADPSNTAQPNTPRFMYQY